jgi:TRAP-type C4-dicarboxylate transport system substrate-binding protein
MGVGAILCNEDWYQSLPDDVRSYLVEAQSVARDAYNRFGAYLDALAMEKLESRIQVHVPTAEQKQAFRDAAVPFMRDYMEERYGRDLVSEFLATAQGAEKIVQEGKGPAAGKSKYDFETLWSLVSDKPAEKISEDK